MNRTFALVGLALVLSFANGAAQAPAGVDPATISRIRGEAMTRSQAMDPHWWLSEASWRSPAHSRPSRW